MNAPKPHFLLFCDGNYPSSDQNALDGKSQLASRWRFVLENVESGEKFEASDREVGASSDRMALVAVLRGLESLEQPSRVTLVTTSRYVFRGLQYGLTEWRDNDFSWEHFGTVQPIRNADIWRRIDRTLTYHKVQCRWISQDVGDQSAHEEQTDAKSSLKETASSETDKVREDCPSSERATESTQSAPVAIFKDGGQSLSSRMQSASIVSSPVTPSIDIVASVNAKEEVEKKCEQESEQANRKTPSLRSVPEVSRSPGVLYRFGRLSRFARMGWLIPLRLKRTVARSVDRIWNWILKMDEEVDGYFRCLFLLEPKKPKRNR
jgi:ribonuclease HI